MKSQVNGKIYLYGLEHIRGLASVFILLFHSTLFINTEISGKTDIEDWPRTKNVIFSLILEGHTFVSVFLIISAFLLFLSMNTKEVRYFDFLKKGFGGFILCTYLLFWLEVLHL